MTANVAQPFFGVQTVPVPPRRYIELKLAFNGCKTGPRESPGRIPGGLGGSWGGPGGVLGRYWGGGVLGGGVVGEGLGVILDRLRDLWGLGRS